MKFKHDFIGTDKPPFTKASNGDGANHFPSGHVHTGKRSFPKTLFKPEEFENSGFAF